jgi:hypothetical protein
MGATDLSLPTRVRAIHPDDVAVVEAWAAEQRAELLLLRAEARRAVVDAEVAEAALATADGGCPPELATAIDAMMSAAMERLDYEVRSAQQQSAHSVDAVMSRCYQLLVEAGAAPTVDSSASWRETVRSYRLRRPRSAAELWGEMVRGEARVLASGLTDPDALPGEPAVNDGEDAFELFWRDAQSQRPLLGALRRMADGRRE